MKKLFIICMTAAAFSISGCGSRAPEAQNEYTSFTESATMSQEDGPSADTSGLEHMEEITISDTGEDDNMQKIEIVVGDRSFSATLCDNEAARTLSGRLPMTLDMSELNGNEKYYYLSEGLPTDSDIPSGIHAGDLMLYGDNCLVLFYESFLTSYSYTPLGHVDNAEELAAALGSGDVQITFR